MTTLRKFCCNDLLRITNFHIDHLGQANSLSFFISYMAVWNNSFYVVAAPFNRIMGYIVGKIEGEQINKHGEIASVTVAGEYGKLALVKKLMNSLEEANDKIDKAYFTEVLVRPSNTVAMEMYQRLGYVISNRLSNPGEGDWIQMRKALSGLLAITEYMASMQPSASDVESVPYKDPFDVPYDGPYDVDDDDDESSWLSDDKASLTNDDDDDDDGTNEPSEAR